MTFTQKVWPTFRLHGRELLKVSWLFRMPGSYTIQMYNWHRIHFSLVSSLLWTRARWNQWRKDLLYFYGSMSKIKIIHLVSSRGQAESHTARGPLRRSATCHCQSQASAAATNPLLIPPPSIHQHFILRWNRIADLWPTLFNPAYIWEGLSFFL